MLIIIRYTEGKILETRSKNSFVVLIPHIHFALFDDFILFPG